MCDGAKPCIQLSIDINQFIDSNQFIDIKRIVVDVDASDKVDKLNEQIQVKRQIICVAEESRVSLKGARLQDDQSLAFYVIQVARSRFTSSCVVVLSISISISISISN